MRRQGLLYADCDVEVPFHDVDLATVVWHGHYLKYLENSRWQLMRRIGYDYADMVASGYGWPIVEAHVKYVRAARYGQSLRVRASLIDWSGRLTIHYLVTDNADDARVARAKTVQVAIDMRTEALQYELPEIFTTRVAAAMQSVAR
ncbi:MAG: acyl-CoA thioesterase [Proteobacteria bacterium]|nr:acyl-CoA thioesterase [Pseudomonadota bacterium]